MPQLRFRTAFVIVLLVYTCLYGFYISRYPKLLLNPDLPIYSAILLQTENPSLYARDPMYGGGNLVKTYWSSGYLYMRLFQALHALTQYTMSSTLALLHFIPGLLSVMTFYWFLRVFDKDRLLTLGMSVSLSLWLVMGYNEGIPTLYYLALAPIFCRLLWTSLINPSLTRGAVVEWQVILVGVLIALSSLLINSVSGLGFSLFALVSVTLQWLAGLMRWRAYAAFVLGLVPVLGFISLGGVGGATTQLNAETALHYINGDFVASALTRGQFLIDAVMKLFQTPFTLVFYAPMVGGLALTALQLRRSQRTSKRIKILYILLSWVLTSSLLGSVGVILTLYFSVRALTGRNQAFDIALITAMNVGILIGPVFMWVVVGGWSITQWHALALILFQMFRFPFFAYLVVSVALLFMIEDLTQPITSVVARRIFQLTLIGLVPLQSQGTPTVALPLLALLMIVCLLLLRVGNPKQASSSKAVAPMFFSKNGQLGISMACFVLAAIALWASPSGEVLFRRSSPLMPNHQFTSLSSYRDYLDMTTWLRTNTPQDSLIHFEKRWDWSFFRYLTQRALLFNWTDDRLATMTSDMYARVRDIIQSLETTPLIFFGKVTRQYDLNYIVLFDRTLSPLPYKDNGSWMIHHEVYHNATYRVYEVQRVHTQTPTTLFVATFDLWLRPYLRPIKVAFGTERP